MSVKPFSDEELEDMRKPHSGCVVNPGNCPNCFDCRYLATIAADREKIADYQEVCFLIGSIFFHGDFRAETTNERELEKLLRKLGYFFESEDELLARLRAGKERTDER